jgi:hypothetical protein
MDPRKKEETRLRKIADTTAADVNTWRSEQDDRMDID